MRPGCRCRSHRRGSPKHWICTSSMNPSGNNGRMGRSMFRMVRISRSLGALHACETGNYLPAADIFSRNHIAAGRNRGRGDGPDGGGQDDRFAVGHHHAHQQTGRQSRREGTTADFAFNNDGWNVGIRHCCQDSMHRDNTNNCSWPDAVGVFPIGGGRRWEAPLVVRCLHPLPAAGKTRWTIVIDQRNKDGEAASPRIIRGPSFHQAVTLEHFLVLVRIGASEVPRRFRRPTNICRPRRVA